MIVNKEGYISRTTGGREDLEPKAGRHYRDWFLVKETSSGTGIVTLGRDAVKLPKEYIGKRIRFKTVMVKDRGDD
jgi:hypothetical protein